jgi:fluoride exporter
MNSNPEGVVAATAVAETAPTHPGRTSLEAGQPHFSLAQLRVLSILVGGAAGALARAGLAEALPHRGGSWPWATFIVNLAGALFLGWLLTRLAERIAPTRHWRLLLGTGLCGALTTFSTFQIETIRLAKDGYVGVAIAYAVVSIALGMACAVAGTVAARWGRYR